MSMDKKRKKKENEETWICPTCTFVNRIDRPGCQICACENPEQQPGNLQNGIATASVTSDVGHEITESTWECPRCTFVNPRPRPGCKMCAAERPDEAMPGYSPEKKLLSDCRNIITATDNFECQICLEFTRAEDGVRLRECHCEICKVCARSAVQNCDGGEVFCPLCSKPMCDRDIKHLVSDIDWDHFLRKKLQSAEAHLKEAFHCLTPDCVGFVEIVSLDAEPIGGRCAFFMCPRCSKVNCIDCKGQHEGQTCEDFRANNALRKRREEDIKKSELYLKELVNKGQVMKCPDCGTICERDGGCDWLMCGNRRCRLELCWWTKGPRWGPMGRGDERGGCKCRVNGKRCHPNCINCH